MISIINGSIFKLKMYQLIHKKSNIRKKIKIKTKTNKIKIKI